MNKIISFSLWGSNQMYVVGAFENIRIQKIFYPDWRCRFYVPVGYNREVISALKEQGAQIESVVGYERTNRYWRMRVAFDKTVDKFMIRDTDSRISNREAQAVYEWEKSKFPVHLMHDHVRHTAPIMGGLWGAIKDFLPEFEDKYWKWVERMEGGWESKTRLGKPLGDQPFLKIKIWPEIKENYLGHSGEKAPKFSKEEKPFPVAWKHPNNFVGQIFDINNKPVVR